jgi:phosphoglycolate phosphatase
VSESPDPEPASVTLRLAIFDCDGTLADSEASIVQAVRAAFADHGLALPARAQIVSNIGLSLGSFLDEVAPELGESKRREVLDSYRAHFARRLDDRGADPLFPGIEELLGKLQARGVLLGIATGKSRRGLDRFLNAHALGPRFATLQTADDAPSKPHPGMIERALAETGTEAAEAVMIGDTTFDIGAGINAGVRSIGVGWGHHESGALLAAGATGVARDSTDLEQLLLG